MKMLFVVALFVKIALTGALLIGGYYAVAAGYHAIVRDFGPAVTR